MKEGNSVILSVRNIWKTYIYILLHSSLAIASEVSLESPIIALWWINEVKKRGNDALEGEGQACNTDNIYQAAAAANVTGR